MIPSHSFELASVPVMTASTESDSRYSPGFTLQRLGERVTGHADRILDISFNTTGDKIITTGFGDHSVRVWDASSRACLLKVGVPRAPRTALLLHDQLLCTQDNSFMDRVDIRRYNMEGEELAVALQTPQLNNLKFMALSHDGGQFVAVGGEAAHMYILKTTEETSTSWPVVQELVGPREVPHSTWVYSAAWSRDGQYLALASQDRTATVYENTRWVEGLAGRDQAAPWFKVLRKLSGHVGSVIGVDFGPAPQNLLTLASADGSVSVWEAASGTCLCVLRGHDGAVHIARFSPLGDYVLSCANDLSIITWMRTNEEGSTWEAVGRFPHAHDLAIRNVVFSPDGTTVASCSWDNTWSLYLPPPRLGWQVQLSSMLLALESPGSALHAIQADALFDRNVFQLVALFMCGPMGKFRHLDD